jgi:Spy/CpxP family protein refolding chaperone
MGKKLQLALLGLATLGLLCIPAYGQHHFMGMGPMGDGPGMMLPLLLKGVNLTTEQQTRVRGIMDTHRPTLHTLFQQLRTAHEEMANKLFAPGAVQAGDLTPQVQHIAQLREQLMQEGLKVTLEVREVLTAEQLAKAAEIKQRMQTLHQEMRNLLQEKNSGNGPEEDVLFFHAP